MSKITLMDLLDLDIITEGEIKLLLDITKDQWEGRSIIKTLSNNPNYEDGKEFYSDAYQKRFYENIKLLFVIAEEEMNVPLINHVDIEDFSFRVIEIIDSRPKRRRKNIKKLRRLLVS